MSICKNCSFEHLWVEESASVPKECEGCVVIDGKASNYKPKPKTNADRIRAMSDEELADIMSMHTATGACNDWGIPHEKCGGNCRECIIDWLNQPAEEVQK